MSNSNHVIGPIVRQLGQCYIRRVFLQICHYWNISHLLWSQIRLMPVLIFEEKTSSFLLRIHSTFLSLVTEAWFCISLLCAQTKPTFPTFSCGTKDMKWKLLGKTMQEDSSRGQRTDKKICILSALSSFFSVWNAIVIAGEPVAIKSF